MTRWEPMRVGSHRLIYTNQGHDYSKWDMRRTKERNESGYLLFAEIAFSYAEVSEYPGYRTGF